MEHTNLTRKKLAKAIADKLGYSQNSCAQIVDSFLGNMKDTLLAGERIKLIHYGTFIVRDKKPRIGRNPRTGEPITIAERQMVSFRPSKTLRKKINS